MEIAKNIVKALSSLCSGLMATVGVKHAEKKPNKENEILAYLMQGNSLTVNECLKLFSTSELRHYISRINQRGYDVIGEWISVKCADGHETKIKRYWIG